MTNDELFSQLLDKISSFDYIHADQIPNIDLYMDQVTTFMDTHLGATRRYDEDKVLTKTITPKTTCFLLRSEKNTQKIISYS